MPTYLPPAHLKLAQWSKHIALGCTLVAICATSYMLGGCSKVLPTNSSTSTGAFDRVTIGELAWSDDGHLQFAYQIEQIGNATPVTPLVGVAACIFLDGEGGEVGEAEYRFEFEHDFRKGKVQTSLHEIKVPVPPKAVYIVVQLGADSSARTNRVRIPARPAH
jgi:hypothetical protein